MIHATDMASAQKQSGLRTLPNAFLDEYERVASMLARDGVNKPLGGREICHILRSCDIEGPTVARPSEFAKVVVWDKVPKNSLVVYSKDPANPRIGELQGVKTNGCLLLKFEGDAALRECAQRHCTPHESVDNDPWRSVPKGRNVLVLRDGQEVDGKFVSIVNAGTLSVQFAKGRPIMVAKDSVKLAS